MTNSDPVHTDDARFLALLERWLQGDFTRTDERELHALTEADDFRREAWEGFVMLPEGKHETHLAAIRRRLRPRPGHRVPMGMWAAVAATAVVLVFAVYFLPRLLKNENPPVALQSESASPLPQDLVDSGDRSGQGFVAAEESDGLPQAKARSKSYPVGPASEMIVSDDLAATTESAVPDINKKTEIVVTPMLPPINPSDSLYSRSGGPASNQQILVTETIPGGPAQNMATKPEAVRYDPPAAAPRKQAAEPTDKMSRQADEKKETEEPAPVVQATPAGGWDNFRRYLRDKARLPDAARNNNISGYVQLQFWVGQDGRPANIKVVRPLGYGCDEEAIRLINNVFWTPGGPEATTVEVPFVR